MGDSMSKAILKGNASGTGSVTLESPNTNSDRTISLPDAEGTLAFTNQLGMRNRIINGAMQIWQRGTSITTSGGYTADRWTQVSGNSIAHTQSTDAPTGFTSSLQMVGTGSNICQRIESVNCIGLGSETITISLWYKNSSGSDSLSLALYYCNTADSFGSVTQIGTNQTLSASPSSSWTKYTVTFTNISANAVNGLALYIFRGSSATATGLLTGVQLEVGSSATGFEYRQFTNELALCQRYYTKSYDLNVIPYNGVNTNVGAISFYSTNGNGFWGNPFKVTMRTTPTVTTYSYQGNSGLVGGASNAALTAVTYQQGMSGFNVYASGNSSAGDFYCNYTATAEL